MNEVQVSYLPRAGSHWGCQHRASEMNYLSALRVTAPSYLIWLSYHLLRRCQPCSIYCSEPLSRLRRFPSKRRGCVQPLSWHNTKEWYAIKSCLLNRSVYLYGNNDHFKSQRVMTCKTRQHFRMQVLSGDVMPMTLRNFYTV